MSIVEIEVVYALPERSWTVPLELPVGSTVGDALERVRNEDGFSTLPLDEISVGVWGERSARDRVLENHDRIEIYRPLMEDPVTARRRRAGADKR